MIQQRLAAVLVAAAALSASDAIHGRGLQSTRPDFSGTWQVDSERSKALTEKHGQVWRVVGASAGGGNPAGGAAGTNTGPVTVITQSATELIMERRGDGEIIDRTVLKLDGSVSVNATSISSSRSTTVWKGSSLVTTGTTRIDTASMRAADGSGKPIPEITRDFVTTRTLMPDDTIQVETRTTRDGKERVSWTVLVRVKS